MDERLLVDSFSQWVFVWILVTVFVLFLQDLDSEIKRCQRDDFYYRHWEEAEDFIESELNRMGINTVSDLEDDKDE